MSPMRDDDRTAGRLLTRREALAAACGIGITGLWPALARSQSLPACIVRPEQTEGPYFVDTGLARTDIRTDTATGTVEAGVPLQLEFLVSRVDANGCRPLPQAQVELWQCNASGSYSGVRDPHADTRGRNFLRGYQITDAGGRVRFTTIYPGWYPGRAVHLHFSIRAGQGGRREAFTSQLYFDDALSDRILAQPLYSGRGQTRVRNGADFIYRRGGPQLTLAVNEANGRLGAVFEIGLQSETRRG